MYVLDYQFIMTGYNSEQPDTEMNRAGCGERGRELPGPLQAWHHLPAPPRDHQPGGPSSRCPSVRVFNGGFVRWAWLIESFAISDQLNLQFFCLPRRLGGGAEVPTL